VTPATKTPPGRVSTPTPAPIEHRVLARVADDLRRERRTRRHGTLPPGSLAPSARNTYRTLADPLALLLEHHERFGPVFTIRTVHEAVVWAIGPDTNQEILVRNIDAYSLRLSRYRELEPLLGAGMLNIDGSYHREMRRVMLPAFYKESVAAVAEQMVQAGVAAAERLVPGSTVDMYEWTRELALDIALRALLGMDARDDAARRLAHAFEEALALYGHFFPVQMLRGPRTPYARAMHARDEVDRHVLAEIERRRRAGDPGGGVLGLLLAATDEDGAPLDTTVVRDQTVTLLFAGHDTTTATLTFLLHELGRTIDARAALEAELDAVLPDRDATAAELQGTALPVLERSLDETLRRFPPAWVGPRRAVQDVVLHGHPVPDGTTIHYSSLATHHLPDLYPDPLAFRPDRFLPEESAARPQGAYIPFGGGTRMCLGKRFGQVELRALSSVLLRRLRFEPDPTTPLRLTTTPTLGPKGGLRFRVYAR
jgi:cytochrome P450